MKQAILESLLGWSNHKGRPGHQGWLTGKRKSRRYREAPNICKLPYLKYVIKGNDGNNGQ